jgi:MFS family permease
MGALTAYRRVLRNPALARLLFGEFVSSVGDWLYLVALLVVVYEQTQDPLVLGIIGAARVLPYVLLSVPAGIAADRYDRRVILLSTDIIRGLIMVVIAAIVFLNGGAAMGNGATLAVVVLAVLATCFSAFFSPAIGAFLPSLVKDESELGPANSLWSSLDNLAFFVGPAFAAVLLGLGQLPLAFLLNALTFGVVAIVLWRLPSAMKPARADAAPIEVAVEEAKEEAAQAAKAPTTGLREALTPVIRPLSGIATINIVGGFVFGGLGMLTVILAVQYYDVGDAGTGLFNSAIGVGGIVGAFVAGALVLRRRLGPPMLIGAVLIGASVVALGILPAEFFGLALIAMAVASAGSLLTEIVSTTLFQRIVPDEIRGRTIGIMDTASVLAYAAGSLLLPIIAANNPLPALVASGVAMAVAGAIAVVLLGRYAVQDGSIDDERRKLGDVELFQGLNPAAIETAMRAATVVPLHAAEVVIRQGDQADRFYVIADGRVEVTQTPPEGGQARVLRQMGPGEFFGEIGLLSNVPRTATVTGLSDGRLVALDREPFLELVNAGQGLTYRLLDLHRGASTTAG